MKRTLTNLLPAILLVLPVASCTENAPEQDWTTPKENMINLSLSATNSGEAVIWPEKTVIGIFCEQTGSVNVPVEISAASAGGEVGEFYSDIEYSEGEHQIYIYWPYQENITSTVLTGNLAAAWAQTGTSSSHLTGGNLFCAQAVLNPSSDQSLQAVEMEPVFELGKVTVSSEVYKGYDLDVVSITPKGQTTLSGPWSYNMVSGELEMTAEQASSLTLNVSGVTIGDAAVDVWYLTALKDEMPIECDFSVTVSNDDGNVVLTRSADLTEASALAIDSWSSTVVGDESVDLSDPKGSGARETANCYIAGEAGKTYRFPATVMGNGYTTPADPSYSVQDGTAPGTTPSILAPTSAAVLWQTSKGLITNVKLRNGFVYFDLPGGGGNRTPSYLAMQ